VFVHPLRPPSPQGARSRRSNAQSAMLGEDVTTQNAQSAMLGEDVTTQNAQSAMLGEDVTTQGCR